MLKNNKSYRVIGSVFYDVIELMFSQLSFCYCDKTVLWQEIMYITSSINIAGYIISLYNLAVVSCMSPMSFAVMKD